MDEQLFVEPTELLFPTVEILNNHHIHAFPEEKRRIKTSVSLPALSSNLDTVIMNLNLDCPSTANGNRSCDWWDRKGYVLAHVGKGDGEKVYEIMRFVTPYRVGAQWRLDVSDLRAILHGQVTFEVFIDTWVGPGHAQGSGWLVNLSLDYSFEGKQRKAVAVLPLFESASILYGDPRKNPKRMKSLSGLPEHSEARVSALLTGHGQNVGSRSNNCAEFCDKVHTFTINDEVSQHRIWRNDCAETKTNGEQRGTWTLPRAGWCPGDIVRPLQIDLRGYNPAMTVSWAPESWSNPENTGFDNNKHTPPFYQISAFLVLYE